MSDASSPAGWHSDPDGTPGRQRWWDGNQWNRDDTTTRPTPTTQAAVPQGPGPEKAPGGPWWKNWWVGIPIAFLLGTCVGGVASSGEGQVAAAEDEAQRAQAEIARLQEDVAEAQAALEQASTDVEAAEAAAADAESSAAAEAEERIADVQAKIDRAQDALKERERDLDKRQAAVRQEEAAANKSSFSDGVYEVGVDVVAGTYKAGGGSNCYWARLEAGSQDILDNHIGGGQVVATLNEGELFESSGCGEWTKTG